MSTLYIKSISSCNIYKKNKLSFVSWMDAYALLQGAEFSKSVDTDGYQFYEGYKVFCYMRVRMARRP